MNAIKKYLGLVWMLLAPLILYILVSGAVLHIDPAGKKDINNPIIWIIIITIFSPIVLGMFIFGWYAFKNEYEHLPESSADLKE